jgi:hypothetical protein
VNRIKSEYSLDHDGFVPNQKLLNLLEIQRNEV